MRRVGQTWRAAHQKSGTDESKSLRFDVLASDVCARDVGVQTNHIWGGDRVRPGNQRANMNSSTTGVSTANYARTDGSVTPVNNIIYPEVKAGPKFGGSMVISWMGGIGCDPWMVPLEFGK